MNLPAAVGAIFHTLEQKQAVATESISTVEHCHYCSVPMIALGREAAVSAIHTLEYY